MLFINLIFGGLLQFGPFVYQRVGLLLDDLPVQRRAGAAAGAAVFGAAPPAAFISISPQKLFSRMLLNILSHHQLIV